MKHPSRFTICLFAAAAGLMAQDPVPNFAKGTLAAVRDRANAEQRGVVIDFSLDACEPCRRLLATTWRSEALWKWANANALVVRVDPERDASAAKEFELLAYPTIIALDKRGSEVGRVVGYIDGDELLDKLSTLVFTAPTGYKARFELAKRLRRDGKEAAALEHYLWLWDHGEQHNKGFGGVRSSFFLREFVQFGRRYAPAREALEQRRDELEKQVLAGDTNYELVSDMVYLNRAMNTRERLVKILDGVPEEKWARHKIARRVLVDNVTDVLVAAKRYADAVRYIGDPVAAFDKATNPFEGAIANAMPPRVRRDMAKRALDKQSLVLEAFFGAKKETEAGALAERLIEVKSDADTWVIVLQAAKKAGNDRALHDWGVRALQDLDEEDHERIRRLLKRR